jgi:hypothetical protein
MWLLCSVDIFDLISIEIWQLLCESIFVVGIGAAVDLDHFIAATSFSYQAASSLPSRPFGHNLIFVFLPCSVAWYLTSRRIAAMVSITYTLHLLRDGLRRGLWIYPFDPTKPVPMTAYGLTIFSFPVLCQILRIVFINIRNSYISSDRCVDDEQQHTV